MASVLKGIITTKENGNAVFAIHFTIDNIFPLKAFNQLYITNKAECFSFKIGYAKR